MPTEPVLTAAAVSGAIIAVLSIFQVGVEPDAVEAIVAAVLPFVLALLARAKVTPV